MHVAAVYGSSGGTLALVSDSVRAAGSGAPLNACWVTEHNQMLLNVSCKQQAADVMHMVYW